MRCEGYEVRLKPPPDNGNLPVILSHQFETGDKRHDFRGGRAAPCGLVAQFVQDAASGLQTGIQPQRRFKLGDRFGAATGNF